MVLVVSGSEKRNSISPKAIAALAVCVAFHFRIGMKALQVTQAVFFDKIDTNYITRCSQILVGRAGGEDCVKSK